MRFLSTLSLRRATNQTYFPFPKPSNFYPRSPCGERRLKQNTATISNTISIHALLAESDRKLRKGKITMSIFLSTLSLRRATRVEPFHATSRLYFYPRSPCGERLWPGLLARPFFIISIHALLAESDQTHSRHFAGVPEFLSTLSLRRATVGAIGQLQCVLDFYPRSPCGERLGLDGRFKL